MGRNKSEFRKWVDQGNLKYILKQASVAEDWIEKIVEKCTQPKTKPSKSDKIEHDDTGRYE